MLGRTLAATIHTPSRANPPCQRVISNHSNVSIVHHVLQRSKLDGRRSCNVGNTRVHAQPTEHTPDSWRDLLRRCAGSAVAVGLAFALSAFPPDALAVLVSPNAQVARTVDAALRRSTPAFNPQVKSVQQQLEYVQFQMRIPQRKPWGSMSKNIRDSIELVSDSSAMMSAVPQGQEGVARELISSLTTQLERLQFHAERKDIERTSQSVASSLSLVAKLEIVQAPALSFQVPQAYRSLPLLTGRAVVDMVVEKADGSAAFIDPIQGGLNKQGHVQITLDGFSSPVGAGNFAKLVADGKYDGSKWKTGYLAVSAGKGAAPGATVPLEILPIGEFEPVYRTPLDVLQGELPVLPLSIKGAVSYSKIPDVDGYLSGEEWFIFLFDPQQSGLSGLSFDEGQFGVFGYVTEGINDVVSKLSAEDRIVSARIVAGQDKLINA